MQINQDAVADCCVFEVYANIRGFKIHGDPEGNRRKTQCLLCKRQA